MTSMPVWDSSLIVRTCGLLYVNFTFYLLARGKTFGPSAQMDTGFVAEYRRFERRLWSGRFSESRADFSELYADCARGSAVAGCARAFARTRVLLL